MSFANFLKKNLAFFKLAVISNIEYRFNFLVDAVVQPSITSLIEVFLWLSIFKTSGQMEIAGYGQDYYLSYVLWATFLARIAASWMYEFRMIEDVESGSINSLLVRPISFYEYYLSQLLGYKFITTAISLIIPVAVILYFQLPTFFERIPLAILLVFYYLILVHSISFVISCLAFFLNKVHYFVTTKNFIFWLLTGELFPIDLVPETYRHYLLPLPFSSGVYIPTAYLTGRCGLELVIQGFLSITAGLVVVNALGAWLWNQGLKSYSGTGA